MPAATASSRRRALPLTAFVPLRASRSETNSATSNGGSLSSWYVTLANARTPRSNRLIASTVAGYAPEADFHFKGDRFVHRVLRWFEIVFASASPPASARPVRAMTVGVHHRCTSYGIAASTLRIGMPTPGLRMITATLTPQLRASPRMVTDSLQNEGTRRPAQVHPMLSLVRLAAAERAIDSASCRRVMRRPTRWAVDLPALDQPPHGALGNTVAFGDSANTGSDWDARFPWAAGSF